MKGSGSTDPVEIRIDRERRQMAILWQDEHRSVYPFDLLRKECPCALCGEARRKHEKGGLTLIATPVLRPGEAQVEEHHFVGRYAIAFRWNDGHDQGIYSFDLLRGLCPCDRCRPGG